MCHYQSNGDFADVPEADRLIRTMAFTHKWPLLICEPDGGNFTSTKLAVGRQIEHSEVAGSALDLALHPDRPEVLLGR